MVSTLWLLEHVTITSFRGSWLFTIYITISLPDFLPPSMTAGLRESTECAVFFDAAEMQACVSSE